MLPIFVDFLKDPFGFAFCVNIDSSFFIIIITFNRQSVHFDEKTLKWDEWELGVNKINWTVLLLFKFVE